MKSKYKKIKYTNTGVKAPVVTLMKSNPDLDIKTGKYILKWLDDKDFEQLIKDGESLSLSTWFDFDYEDCIDEKKKPIELNY